MFFFDRLYWIIIKYGSILDPKVTILFLEESNSSKPKKT